MFAMSNTNISRSFIMILRRIQKKAIKSNKNVTPNNMQGCLW